MRCEDHVAGADWYEVTRTLLVVDDDPNVRQLVRRVVQKDFDATLIEAEHGLAAIDALMETSIDLMLLDISMPIMDGLETLDAVRRIPQLAQLPVMILAAKAEEDQVQQLIGLGISGFVVKPFRPVLLRDRLANVLGRLPARPALRPRPSIGGLELETGCSVLLLDDSAEFRVLFSELLAPMCEVHATGSVTEALDACTTTPRSAIFVGAVDSAIQAELFARKARLATEAAGTPIVALASVGAREAAEAAGLYELTVLRSFMPTVLRSSLRDAMSTRTVARWLLAPAGPAAGAFRDAVAEQLARVLARDLSVGDEQPAWAALQGRWVTGHLEAQAHGLSWQLSIELPYTSALAVAEADLGFPGDQLGEPHLTTAAANAAARLGSALASSVEGELDIELAEPTTEIAVRAADATVPVEGGRRWWLTWNDGRDGAGISLAPLVSGSSH